MTAVASDRIPVIGNEYRVINLIESQPKDYRSDPQNWYDLYESKRYQYKNFMDYNNGNSFYA